MSMVVGKQLISESSLRIPEEHEQNRDDIRILDKIPMKMTEYFFILIVSGRTAA